MTATKGDKKEKKAKVESEVKIAEEIADISETEIEIEKLEKEKAEITDSFKRLAAEFDNYRKRTAREKDEIFKNATASLVEAFLPAIDSMEMAKTSVEENAEKADLKKGIELVYRQFREILEKLDVDEIECIGEEFDPEFHNAIMHVTDDQHGENEVIEVLQKGYVFKDKVIRHSIVKVAN